MKVKGSVLHFYLFFIIKSRFQSIFSETELKSKIPYLTAKKKNFTTTFLGENCHYSWTNNIWIYQRKKTYGIKGNNMLQL